MRNEWHASAAAAAVRALLNRGTAGWKRRDVRSSHHTIETMERRVLLSSAIAAFGAQQTFGTGSSPFSVATADVNADGKADLILANGFNGAGGNSVSVLLGNGNGTFQAQKTFTVGTTPRFVTVADVNGDGKPDVLVANYSSNSVSVLLGNGNGTFQGQLTFGAGGGPEAVAVADFNGDGIPDLAVPNLSGNDVSVLLGNGNGTFQAQHTFATGASAVSVVTPDVNGDGKPDLVVANYGGNVSVLLSNGNGTFQAQTTFAAGTNPRSIAAADVSGDGKVDLIVDNKNSNTLSVLLGNGNGSFQAQTTFATGTNPQAVAIADVNVDGRPDLLVANLGSSTISVLLGNGNGAFQSQTTFATGTGPQSVGSADVNGDGRPDLVVANLTSNNVGVLLGDVQPVLLSINRAAPVGSITNASSVSFTVTFNKAVTGVDPTDFAVATTGTVGYTLTQVTGSGTAYTVTISGISGSGSLGLNFVDNGSVKDLAGNPLQPGALSFAAQSTFATGTSPLFLATADVNGDGKLDVISSNFTTNTVSVLLGNGNGTFQAQHTFTVGSGPRGIAVADVNRDGKPDLIVANENDNNVGVLLGNGNGTFQNQVTYAVGIEPFSIAVADFDGNGTPDLVVANFSSNASLLFGNGNGTFQPQSTFAAGSTERFVAAGADLDGDGKPDVVVVNRDSGTVTFVPNSGTTRTFTVGTGPYSVAIADVNGDGKPDLIISNDGTAVSPGNSVGVLLGNGNGTFQNQVTFAAGSAPFFASVFDVNGDGKPDLLVANHNSNSVSVLLGNGNGTFQSQITFGIGSSPWSVLAADFNGDGKPDLLVADSSGSSVGVLLANSTSNVTGPVYTIDTIFPSVSSFLTTSLLVINPADVLPTASLTFSEPVTGVDSSDFVVTKSGSVADALVQVTGSGSAYTVTVSGVTGNGTLGLNLVDNGSIRDLVGNPLRNGSSAAFGAPQTFATGASPQSVATADLNNDGKLDIVTANQNANTVSVLLGNGNGTFQAQQTFATGASPRFVAVADVNGDGKLDLVVANLNANTVSVLLGNGNGTFQAQQTFATGASPRSVAIADLNGDSKPDLVVANYGGNTVSVLLGNGNGTFQAQQTFATGLGSFSVAIADLNGDGKPDVVSANYGGSGSASVLLGNGNGTFQAQQTFATGFGPRSVAVADVNGDGKPDLIVGNKIAGSVSVLLGNGNGAFQAQQTFATGTSPLSVAVADVNGDGNPDLVTADYSSPNVSVLLGNGNGTFQAQQTFSVPGAASPSVAVADFNGDGRLDLATANTTNSVGVFLANGAATFTGPVYTIDTIFPFVTGIGPITPFGPNTSVSWTVFFNEPVTGVDPTDFSVVTSGITYTNLQVTGGPTSYTATVSGIVRTGAPGTVRLDLVDNNSIRDLAGNPLIRSAIPTFQPAQALGGVGTALQSLATADLNADGFPDIVVNNVLAHTTSVLLGNGDGSFHAAQTFAANGNPAVVVVGDVNGDGKPDLIIGNYYAPSAFVSVLLGNGNGTFQAPQTFTTGAEPASIAIADVNGDGKPDLLVANSYNGVGGNSVSVLLGNGNGTFQNQTTLAVGMGPSSISVADLNGDGKTDLIVANVASANVSVLLGNGNGTFQPQQTFAAANPFSLAVSDVNGDGQVDLVMTEPLLNAVSVLLGNGNGTFQAQQTFATGSAPQYIATSDINGDGKPDLIVSDYLGKDVGILLGRGDGTFQPAQTFSVGNKPTFISVSDLNGDGRPDVVVVNSGDSTIGELLNNANGSDVGTTQTIAAATTVTAINRSSPSTPITSATSLTYAVTFSASVANVSASDFQVITTGTVVVGSPLVLSGSGSSYTVTINGVRGSGTVQLVLIDHDTIVDAFPNPLGGPGLDNGSFTGQAYSILQTYPTVVSINRTTPGSFTTASSVSYTVTFNETVTGVAFGSFAGVTTGTVAFTGIQLTGGPTVYTVTLTGVSGKGTLGLNLVDNGTIKDAAGNLLQTGTASFAAPTPFGGTLSTYSHVYADVNGDGVPDLVTVSYTGPSFVSVQLGNGNGTFQSATTFATGSGPMSVAVADLNGDGKPDLVVTNYYSQNYSISVLLGHGDGTFQPQQTIGVGNPPADVVVADVNGDGRPDLLVACQGFAVSVLLGNGDGTFQAAPTVPFAGNSYAGARVIAVADVNGDGKLDLISTNQNGNNFFGIAGNTVGVLLGNGNGTFQGQQTFAVGSFPKSVAVTDVNGDGKLDLVVPSFIDGSTSVLLGNGDGTFQNRQTFAGATTTSIGIADANADGRVDLVVGGSVLLNTGNGNFTGQTYTIVPSLDTITGTAGVDQITLVRDPDGQHIDWTLNGTPSGQMSVNDPAGLTINGNGSNDVIILDYGPSQTANPLPNKLNLNGVFTLNGLQGTNPLANTTIDLEKSTLFIKYGVTIGDPLSLIRGYLQTGYNNGAWTGTSANGSINSSAAAVNPNNFAIGYADSADAGNPAAIATANTLELRYAGVGDTNLNNTVDANDYAAVVRGFGTGTTWDLGVVTYDGTVSANDYAAVVRHFGNVVTSPAAVPSTAPEAASTLSAGVLAGSTNSASPNGGTSATIDISGETTTTAIAGDNTHKKKATRGTKPKTIAVTTAAKDKKKSGN